MTLEQVQEAAEKLLRERRNKYNAQHPDRVEQQRTRTYINFLTKRGYFVMDTKTLPEDAWSWDELTQRSILNAVRANALEYRGALHE